MREKINSTALPISLSSFKTTIAISMPFLSTNILVMQSIMTAIVNIPSCFYVPFYLFFEISNRIKYRRELAVGCLAEFFASP